MFCAARTLSSVGVSMVIDGRNVGMLQLASAVQSLTLTPCMPPAALSLSLSCASTLFPVLFSSTLLAMSRRPCFHSSQANDWYPGDPECLLPHFVSPQPFPSLKSLSKTASGINKIVMYTFKTAESPLLSSK